MHIERFRPNRAAQLPLTISYSLMQFSLASLLLAFVVVGASLATFGAPGIIFAIAMLITVAFGKSAGRLWRAVLCIVVIGILVALVLPVRSRSREVMRQERCVANLQSISDALHRYHTEHGCFPPAYLADQHGKPIHSWRVLILPHLGLGGLYGQYDFGEPWDGSHNRKLAAQMPAVFACPSEPDADLPPTITNYVAVVGEETAFPGVRSTRVDELQEGGAESIAVVEVEAKNAPCWMEPVDLPLSEATTGICPTPGARIGSHHVRAAPGDGFLYGAHAAFADGSIRFLPSTLSAPTLRSLLVEAGNENIDFEALGMDRLNENRWFMQPGLAARSVGAVVLAVSLVFMVLQRRREYRRYKAES